MTAVTRHRRQPGLRALAAVSVAAVAALTACSGGGSTSTGATASASSEGTPQKGGTLNMLGSDDVDYLDPNLTYYSAGYTVSRLFGRTPYAYPAIEGKTTKAVPDLATGELEVSPDGLTATWHIREGAKWDTTPARQITAADAIRGVKRACNPAQPFGGMPDFVELFVGYQAYCDAFAKVKPDAAAIADYLEKTNVPGLTVGSDDRTVVLKLTHKAAYLQDMMTLSPFAPVPVEANAYVPASAEAAQHTISNGPYKITSYEPKKKYVFDRNPAWDAATDPVRKAYVDKIVLTLGQTQESIQQQLQTSTPNADLGFDLSVPQSQLPQLIAAKDPNLVLGNTASSNPYIIYNTASPNNNGALAKLEVRQALSYALNRNTIIQALSGPSINKPLSHVLPSVILGGEESYDPYPRDVAKAKQLLAQAGYPNGLTLKFLYRNASQGSSKTFATVQQDLKEVGITVEGVPSPNADFYTKYLQKPDVARRGVWDLSAAGWGADWYGNAALSFFKPLFYGKTAFPPIGSNFGLYESPTALAAIDKATTAKDETEAKALWAAADKAVMADAPFFPITNAKWPLYKATQVKNAVYMDYMQFFDPTNVWLDPAKNGG